MHMFAVKQNFSVGNRQECLEITIVSLGLLYKVAKFAFVVAKFNVSLSQNSVNL